MKKILTGLFVLLYVAVGLVSCWHAMSFFGIANQSWLAVVLAVAFEIGQAAVLFALLTDPTQAKRTMPWILMGVLTAVQIIGNVVASYAYMVAHDSAYIKHFTDSVLFFWSNPNQQANTVIISYIIGAILPLVALCMTGMIVNMSYKRPEKEEPTEPAPTTKFD